MPKPKLAAADLMKEAALFAAAESSHAEPSLFGVTDGKAVGTNLEHKFRSHLGHQYDLRQGNSAKGIDLPDLKDGANEEGIVAYLTDRNLPVDEIEAANIAKSVLTNPPTQGYITISNALQWRLQYRHAIREAGTAPGLWRL